MPEGVVVEHDHHLILNCNGKEDFAQCLGCSLRTPSRLHDNWQWAIAIWEEEERKGTLFYEEVKTAERS